MSMACTDASDIDTELGRHATRLRNGCQGGRQSSVRSLFSHNTSRTSGHALVTSHQKGGHRALRNDQTPPIQPCSSGRRQVMLLRTSPVLASVVAERRAMHAP